MSCITYSYALKVTEHESYDEDSCSTKGYTLNIDLTDEISDRYDRKHEEQYECSALDAEKIVTEKLDKLY